VIADGNGNLYGTTYLGGSDIVGIVYRIAPDGSEAVLHTFSGSDGFFPYADLIVDGSGNLYGTTSEGGTNDDGTVFKLASDGTETVLYSFAGETKHDGAFPYAGLIMDKSGDLYGTTFAGGRGCRAGHGCGTVFKIAADGSETVLHSFKEQSDGAGPSADLIADNAGDLYGITSSGGAHGYGTVFTLGK
jgi:uncharacterized repeat protein (TIGR03803 family)